MILTQEFLKIFLMTGVVSGAAAAILLSGGQFAPDTGISFGVEASAQRTGEGSSMMVFLAYAIHNTGTTTITSVTISTDCCGSTAGGSISAGPGEAHKKSAMLRPHSPPNMGDAILVTFTVSDDAGNTMTVVEPVRLR